MSSLLSARARACAVLLTAATSAWPASPLALDEALKLAESRSPQLAAQQASAEAARALVPVAREWPDPKLVLGLENVPLEGGNKWSLTADNMTMRRVGVMQDIVRADKLAGREAKAAAEAAREAAMVAMQRADLRKEVASAWFERWYAQRSRELVASLAKETELQEAAAGAALAGGKGSATDAVAAQAARAMLVDRELELLRTERRAAAMLSRWIGADADRALDTAPDVTRLPHDESHLRADLESHPHLALYQPAIDAAEAELRLARAASQPDWSVELSYGQRGSAFENMVSLMVRMDLPLFRERRQQPVAAARERQLEQARAQAEDARRRHEAEIRTWLSDWDISRSRLERHRRDLVPLAEERERTALAAYQGGRLDLATVLEARRGVLEARLAALNAEAELARAWAQLAYLIERTAP